MTNTLMAPQELVDKWRRSKLGERPGAQSHFNDLCRMLGHLLVISTRKVV